MATTPKPAALREAIATSISTNLKSYNVAAFCERLGLPGPQSPEDDPFRNKALYVQARLQDRGVPELVRCARAVLSEWDDDALEELVDRAATVGVAGELKNLIFASTGPKPEIVLRDALNNHVEITKGADTCLIYDRPLPDAGLSWAELVAWWAGDLLRETNLDVAARMLYKRLFQSLAVDSPPERLIFHTYAKRYAGDPAGTPALLPQVYLHYDPYLRRGPGDRPAAVMRQRMDFLLLLPGRRRVVLEVDGRQHYAIDDGNASPARYGAMAAEDRRLRLAGYEVYRFGGAELTDPESGAVLLDAFFTALLDDPPAGL